jgi:hypothetical protein
MKDTHSVNIPITYTNPNAAEFAEMFSKPFKKSAAPV